MVMYHKIKTNVMFTKYKSIHCQFKLYEGSKFRINTGFAIRKTIHWGRLILGCGNEYLTREYNCVIIEENQYFPQLRGEITANG